MLSAPWKPDFKIVAQGNATPAAQVEYLLACCRVQRQEIETLQIMVKRMELERTLDEKDLYHQLEVLEQVRKRLEAKAGPAPRKWWQLW